jgi:succinyl-CoA synthetase beta subunit
MKLHEYQSKQIFSKHGIPIPRGKVASSLEEVGQISNSLGGRVVIKSQVLVGGRGKAGGVRLSKSNEESVDLASQILGMQIKGFPVRKVLVEEAVSISQEIYLGIANDRNLQKPVLMASSSGGVDIEEIALKSPEKIIKRTIDPHLEM